MSEATYEIVRKLARGGMAHVLLARRYGPRGIEQLVAIKRPNPEIADDEEHLAAFADEARLLARLSHPHVVSVIALEEDRGVPLLVMEHVDGVTLSELVRRAKSSATGHLPKNEALALALAIAEALAYVHSHLDELEEPLRVVHRDVTPHNVMLSFDGAVKLIDFGIASAASHEVVTRTGVVKGTPGFMAPEQLRGDAVDHRADIFSFGVSLHLLLTGTLPWPTDDDVPAADAAPPRPSDRVGGIEPALDDLVARCLDPSPASRPESMTEVRDVLASVLAASGAHPTMGALSAMVRALVPDHHRPEPPTMLQRAPSKARGRRLPPWAGRYALPALALVAIGVVAYAAGRLLAAM